MLKMNTADIENKNKEEDNDSQPTETPSSPIRIVL